MAEKSLECAAPLVTQVQQLLQMNESLLKTNESLKEMVISVVDLLKDPTRDIAYPDKYSSATVVGTQDLLDPPPLIPGQISIEAMQAVPEDNVITKQQSSVPVDESRHMTAEEIQNENEVYKQKYEGKRTLFVKDLGQASVCFSRSCNLLRPTFIIF